MARVMRVPYIELQHEPLIYLTSVRGHWLLKHSTPKWRIEDPEKGFQRVVKTERAQEIAIAVLDQGRTFPNAIILASNKKVFEARNGLLELPDEARLLVVDGQHRLWAQKFSDFEPCYACVIHMDYTEKDMAKLFLEINDNQKRVPSSLRWDLVRLVRPRDDPFGIAASELIVELVNDRSSPLFQRIDLTGEQKEMKLKQGSLAPEIKNLVSMKAHGLRRLDFDEQYEVLRRYLLAVRTLDPDEWKTGQSSLYNNRVLRALLRLLPHLVAKIDQNPEKIKPQEYKDYLDRISIGSFAPEAIRAAQGSAGIKDIYAQLRKQVRV